MILELPSLDGGRPQTRPGADEYHDPVWLVRREWSSYRLPRLQAVVRATIGELQAIEDVLGKDSAPCGSEPSAQMPDPVMEALRACSEELRDASGVAGSHVVRAAHCTLVRRYIAQQPPLWGATFAAALDSYRRAACAALLVAFRRDAVAT